MNTTNNQPSEGPGRGMSLFLSEIMTEHILKGKVIRVIDIGQSYKKRVEDLKHCKKFVTKNDKSVIINPFVEGAL